MSISPGHERRPPFFYTDDFQAKLTERLRGRLARLLPARDRSELDDIVQQVITNIFVMLGRAECPPFGSESGAINYAIRCGVNLVASFGRKQSKSPILMEVLPEKETLDDFYGLPLEVIQKAVAQLPVELSKYMLAVLEVAGESHFERKVTAADIQHYFSGTSLSTVQRKLQAARQLLESRLGLTPEASSGSSSEGM